MKILKALLWEVNSSILCTLKKIPEVLPTYFVILNPFITCIVTAKYCIQYKEFSWKLLLVPLVLLLLLYFSNTVKKTIFLEYCGIPLARKRFTKRDARGNVDFSLSELPEVIEYVASVEEYCEGHRLYEKAKRVLLLLLLVSLFAQPIVVKAASPENNDVYVLTNEEEVLLQQIALAEAEDQGAIGMAFVMQVVLNRIESDDFPDTLIEVFSQRNQFSTYSNRVYLTKVPTQESKEALSLLASLPNRRACYFENPHGRAETWHSRNLQYVFANGDHVFYK